MVEFLVVSAWHAPVLHQAARAQVAGLEQVSFLASGLLLVGLSGRGHRCSSSS
jgi:hypothetical protein